MFVILVVLALLLIVPGLILYGHVIFRRGAKIFFPNRPKTAKILSWALTAGYSAALVCVFNVSAIFALYFALFSALADGIYLIIRLMIKSPKLLSGAKKLLHSGILPLGVTCVILIVGAVKMFFPVTAEYRLSSPKTKESFNVVFISDTHFGTIQRPSVLEESCEKLNSVSPDIVILGGDIVEEGTSREELTRAFEILGSVNAKYGVYYVFGNHDRATYSPSADFGEEELLAAIEAAGITVLRDSSVSLPCGVSIVGREDASVSSRADISSLVAPLPEEDLIIVADHQPRDGEACAAAGVDLLLSGHTHGGQIWPLRWFFRLVNSPVYGEYDYGECKMIVSSGFTGWGYPVRTQGRCEAVVVSVRPE